MRKFVLDATASSRTPRSTGRRGGIVILLVLVVVVLAAWPGPVSAEGGPYQVYTVRPGDTLSGIAASVGMTTEGLRDLNRLAEPDRLVVGSVLVITGTRSGSVSPSPTAAPAPTPASETPSQTYGVQADDTLSAIAARFDTDVATLARMNALSNEHRIQVGSTLSVPRAAEPVAVLQEHVVEVGETISGIAARFGVPSSEIEGANQLRDPNRIRVGTVLLIPPRTLPLPPPAVTRIVGETAKEFGLDPYLVLALSYLESGWQMDVVSSTGAVGMMQLMPETALWTSRELLGKTKAPLWRDSLTDNTHLGAAYLHHLLTLADNDVPTALAAYYQGWTSVKSNGRFEETQQYVDDVLALVRRFRARVMLW